MHITSLNRKYMYCETDVIKKMNQILVTVSRFASFHDSHFDVSRYKHTPR